MIPTITTCPTLRQLCATQILSSGSDSTFDHYSRSFFEGGALSKLWNELKSGFPQGVLCLQNEMCKIERTYQDKNGQSLANAKISDLFRNLAKQFSEKFIEAGLPLNGLIPVDCQKYSQLQEILTKKWEDEALKVLWEKSISRQVGFGFRAPKLDTPDEIRNWLKNPANAHELMDVERLSLVEMTGLNYQGCKIKAVPPEIGYLTQLHSVYLADHQITHLTEGIFQGCAQLRNVFFDHNQILTLPETLFKGCTQLESVGLSHNQISTLPKALFATCMQLTSLSLGKNEISILPEDLFATCMQLTFLSLADNRINILPENLFANCALFPGVAMKGNPLFCIFSRASSNVTDHKKVCSRSALFSNYNCLYRLSNFVKLLSFEMRNRDKIKGAFEQLELQDRCLIVEMSGSVLGNKIADPQKAEQHLFNDMDLFCRAVREAIFEKFLRIPEKGQRKVYTEVFFLGKQEIMKNVEFMRLHADHFNDLSNPELELEDESFIASELGKAYAYENVLLLIDAMDHAGF